MSVILLESDRFARGTLRSLLMQLGLRTILSARTAEEAWFHVRSQGSSLRFILAEQREPLSEATKLLDQVSKDRDLDRVPFLAINSNLSFLRFRPLTRLARLDGWLQKPFGSSGLFDAMAKAELERQSTRSLMVVLQGEGDCRLQPQLEAQLRGKSPWREIVTVGSLRQLASLESARGAQFGVVLLDPAAYEQGLAHKERDWLPRFKRTGGGGRIPCVSLSRSAQIPQSMRAYCSLCLDPPTSAEAVAALLRTLERRIQSQFAVRVYLSLCRSCLKEGNYRLAMRCARTARRLDPTKVEATSLLAESFLLAKDLVSAERTFREAFRVNPFNPHAHVRLLDLLRAKESEWKLARDEAIRFCPRHPGIVRSSTTQEAA